MAFQPVPGVIQATVVFLLNGENWVNTHYFSHVQAEQSTIIQECADEVDAWMGNAFMPLLSNACSYVRTETRGLGEENSYAGLATAGAESGAVVSNPTPSNVTAVFKRASGLTGRSARGRIYISGMPVTALGADENFFTSAFMNGVLTSLNNLRVVMAAASFTEVVVSRYSNGVKRAEGVSFAVESWSYTTLRVGTQRPRLPTVD